MRLLHVQVGDTQNVQTQREPRLGEKRLAASGSNLSGPAALETISGNKIFDGHFVKEKT